MNECKQYVYIQTRAGEVVSVRARGGQRATVPRGIEHRDGRPEGIPALLLPLDESGGSRLEQRVRRVGESAAEIAVHRNHGRLLKLCAHDDEVGAAQRVREPRGRGPGQRPRDVHAIAADVVDEPRHVAAHNDDSALAARTRNDVGDFRDDGHAFGEFQDDGREERGPGRQRLRVQRHLRLRVAADDIPDLRMFLRDDTPEISARAGSDDRIAPAPCGCRDPGGPEDSPGRQDWDTRWSIG
mgnify:CR=1 FL=1